MANTATLEGVKNTVFFPFKGKNWGLKLLIGGALGLASLILPFIPLIPLFGYAGRVAKRVITQNEDPAMPDWNDWGGLFSEGIKFLGASLLYMLPGFFMMFIGYMVMFSGYFAMLFETEFLNTSQDLIPGLVFGSMAGLFVGMFLMVVGMMLLLAGGVFFAPALGHMVDRGEFVSAFQVREWWPVFRANLSGFLLALVIFFGVYTALIWVAYIFYFTVVLCFLMPFAMMLASFLMIVIYFSIVAVTYRDGVRRLVELREADALAVDP